MIRTIVVRKRTYWLCPIHYEGRLLGYTIFTEEKTKIPTPDERLDDSSWAGWAHFEGPWGAGFETADATAAIAKMIQKKTWVRRSNYGVCSAKAFRSFASRARFACFAPRISSSTESSFSTND